MNQAIKKGACRNHYGSRAYLAAILHFQPVDPSVVDKEIDYHTLTQVKVGRSLKCTSHFRPVEGSICLSSR
jgi:hypothetical protein